MNKKHLTLIFFILFMDMMGLGIMGPIAPQLFDANGHNYLLSPQTSQSVAFIWLGTLLFLFPLFQFFSAPILGEISDKVGRKKILIVCLIGTFFANIITVFGLYYKILPLVLFSKIIDGITGGNMAILTASAADVTDTKSRTKIFGLIGAAFGLSMIISPLIGALLIQYSIILPFVFVSIVSLFNIGFVLRYFKETVSVQNNLHLKDIKFLKSIQNIIDGFKYPVLGKLFTIQVFFVSAFGFFTSFLAAYLLHRFNYSTMEMAYYFLYIGALNVILQGFLIPYIAKKYSDKQVLAFTLPSVAFIMFLYPLIPTSILFLMMTPIFAVVSASSNSNLSGAISSRSPDNIQGKIQGISSSISGMAYAVPQLISGIVASIFGFKGPFIAAAIMYTIATLAFYRSRKHINNL